MILRRRACYKIIISYLFHWRIIIASSDHLAMILENGSLFILMFPVIMIFISSFKITIISDKRLRYISTSCDISFYTVTVKIYNCMRKDACVKQAEDNNSTVRIAYSNNFRNNLRLSLRNLGDFIAAISGILIISVNCRILHSDILIRVHICKWTFIGCFTLIVHQSSYSILMTHNFISISQFLDFCTAVHLGLIRPYHRLLNSTESIKFLSYS